MKAEATMRAVPMVPARVGRRVPLAPLVVALGVLLVIVGAATLTGDDRPIRGRAAVAATPESAGPVLGDWGFVLRADANHVLRYRPGLEPVDFIRTHAFGWDGPTVREVFANLVLLRELRLQPQRSLVDLIRLEARGS